MSSLTSAAIPKRRRRQNTQTREIIQRFFENKAATIGLIIILLIIIACVFSDFITPFDYAKQDYSNKLSMPNAVHWFGTDTYGRDLFTRVLKGGQVSLRVAFSAVALSIGVGTILGSTAGYFGGVYGTIIMRIMDILMSIPSLVLAVAISAALGAGIVNTVIAVSISTMPGFVRIMYASVIAEKDKEYLEAATLSGCGDFRKILMHVIPNTLAPIIVMASMRLSLAILSISSLSFIGLGVQPPTPEWGSIIATGRAYFRTFYPIIIFPGIFIVLTSVCFNLVGDGLRDALDPRLR